MLHYSKILDILRENGIADEVKYKEIMIMDEFHGKLATVTTQNVSYLQRERQFVLETRMENYDTVHYEI